MSERKLTREEKFMLEYRQMQAELKEKIRRGQEHEAEQQRLAKEARKADEERMAELRRKQQQSIVDGCYG